jgi:S1-C subfamily serine protease
MFITTGSGIIIAQVGNTYSVLTAAHVVCERDAAEPCGEYKYEIIAPDGKRYPIDKSTIKASEGVDLAVVKFTSSQTYQVATLAITYGGMSGGPVLDSFGRVIGIHGRAEEK